MKRIAMLAGALLTAATVLAETDIPANGLPSSGAELDDILSILISTNSPIHNLVANLSTNLQVSLPPCKSPVPHQTGNTILEPFDDTKAGLRLAVRIEERTFTNLVIRADATYFDPIRGPANAGAEWKRLEFGFVEGHWRLTRDLDGAIK